MKNEINYASLNLNNQVKKQIDQSLMLLKEVFGSDLLGVYLYGSVTIGGLQKYSDLDLFVVAKRSTTHEEKIKLAVCLLAISGIYMVDTEKRPIEMTIVEQSAVNPWQYPPPFDFQYGEWLRESFEKGDVEPWPSKKMPDLAVLITQLLLASVTLVGKNPHELLCSVPYKDFIAATVDALPSLIAEIESDTRNVLLTLARIWKTVATDEITSKAEAAIWAAQRLPEEYRQVVEKAGNAYQGKADDQWNDMYEVVELCADYMVRELHNEIAIIMLSNTFNQHIKILVHQR